MNNIHKPYFIAETAFHHEGDIDFLNTLIEEIEKLNVNAIKFHITVDLDSYMIRNHDAKKTLAPWCLTEKQWDKVLANVRKSDIILLCNDEKSIDYAIACSFPIKAIEIHATGLNDIFLLDKASQFDHTVILGTGGSTLDEIDYAIQYLKNKGKTDILLMHGFQNYPTDYKDIKLDRMHKLNQLFNLPIGYADHTDPENSHNEFISCLGVANGFTVLEKHVTHVFGEKRIDAQSAVSLAQMKKIIDLAHIVHDSLGKENSLQLSDAELKYGNTGPMKKAIVAKSGIGKGERITKENIIFKRTNASSSIKQNELYKVLNNKALKPIEPDEIIDLTNVEFKFVAQDFSQFENNK